MPVCINCHRSKTRPDVLDWYPALLPIWRVTELQLVSATLMNLSWWQFSISLPGACMEEILRACFMRRLSKFLQPSYTKDKATTGIWMISFLWCLNFESVSLRFFSAVFSRSWYLDHCCETLYYRNTFFKLEKEIFATTCLSVCRS